MQEKDIEQILNAYSDMVVRIAYHHVKNRADAEDIAQEAFVRLITAQPRLENEEHQKAWLIRVTVNLCKNLLRSPRSRELPLDDLEEDRAQEQREIWDAVWRLPAKFRNAVYLYYYEGYSVAETAALLGKKPGTVASWLHRARLRLKTDLTGGI